MWRLIKAASAICIGAAMLLPVWQGNTPTSNVLNLLQAIVGLALIALGFKWLFATAPSTDKPPIKTDLHPLAAASEPSLVHEQSLFEKLYILYATFLVGLPGFVALLSWVVAVQLMGCGLGGENGVYGCGLFGRVIAYVAEYSFVLFLAMCTVLVPLTVVYLFVRLSNR